MHYNKKTRKTTKIVHPEDAIEEKIRQQEREEQREIEFNINYRRKLIQWFEEDLYWGRPTSFNSVEEYIDYLDKEEDESDDENKSEDNSEGEFYDSNDDN